MKTRMNNYQRDMHAYFEARFSGTEKAMVPAIIHRDHAFYRLDPTGFAELLVRVYNQQIGKGIPLTEAELFKINFPELDPKVIRFEVLPREERQERTREESQERIRETGSQMQEKSSTTPFYIATKNRGHALNEVEVGSLATPDGYKLINRLDKDIQVIRTELQRMFLNEQHMPRNKLSRSHPLYDHNPEKAGTLRRLYAESITSATAGQRSDLEYSQIKNRALVQDLKKVGLEQELVDCFNTVTNRLLLFNGEVANRNLAPGIDLIILNGDIVRQPNGKMERELPAVKGEFPSIQLITSQESGTIDLQYLKGDNRARDIAVLVYAPLRALIDKHRN